MFFFFLIKELPPKIPKITKKPIKNILYGDECLKVNEYLESTNKCFNAYYQEDGNFVHYRESPMQVLWSSHTSGSCTHQACMQADGNFVVYDCNEGVRWASDTDGNPGAKIIIQDDGNLVIYGINNVPIWSSHSVVDCVIIKDVLHAGECLNVNEYLESNNKCFKVLYEDSGNFISYQTSSMQAVWSSLTAESCTNQVCMQDDGNFVIYDCNNRPIFTSQTMGHPGSRIIIQNDGNLVIYDSENVPLWASYTVTEC